MAQDIPLDGDLIKILASDTRREILGLLRERRRTVTELADDIELRKATVHEHLKKLVDAGLVQRDEDDRLWVYYDLTPQGKRILNPNRSRIYLVVGLGALAALVGIAALAFFLSQGPTPAAGPSDGGVQVALADEEVVGQQGVQLTAVVNGTRGDDPVRAYLVSAQDTQRLRDGDPSTPGIPLSTAPSFEAATGVQADDAAAADGSAGRESTALRSATRSGPVTFTTDASVPAGTYVLYVRTGSGEDNLDTLPRIRVASLETEVSHGTWWQGISGPLNVTVLKDGRPALGSVELAPAEGPGPHLEQRLVDGDALFAPESLDQIPAGAYTLTWSPEDSASTTRLGDVHLTEPAIAVTPRRSLAGTPTTLTVAVHGGIEPLDAPVRVDGATVQERASRPGETMLQLPAQAPGTLLVQVGRLAERTVELTPGLTASITVEDGPRWRVHLTHPNGTPAADTAIRIDGQGVGFTNATGVLVLDELPEGVHQLAFQTPEGPTITRVVRVDGWSVSPIEPAVSIDATSAGTRDGTLRVEVHLRADGPGRVTGTLTSRLDDRAIDASEIDLPAGERTVSVATPTSGTGQARFSVDLDALETAPLSFRNETTPPSADDDTSGGGGGGGGGGAGGSTGGSTEEMDAVAAGDDGTADEDDGTLLIDLETGRAIPLSSATDEDGDGVATTFDNCPETPNGDQADRDQDGTGDACDETDDRQDTDGDGIIDAEDDCPRERGSLEGAGCPVGLGDGAEGADAVEQQAERTPSVGAIAAIMVLAGVGVALAIVRPRR